VDASGPFFALYAEAAAFLPDAVISENAGRYSRRDEGIWRLGQDRGYEVPRMEKTARPVWTVGFPVLSAAGLLTAPSRCLASQAAEQVVAVQFRRGTAAMPPN